MNEKAEKEPNRQKESKLKPIKGYSNSKAGKSMKERTKCNYCNKGFHPNIHA